MTQQTSQITSIYETPEERVARKARRKAEERARKAAEQARHLAQTVAANGPAEFEAPDPTALTRPIGDFYGSAAARRKYSR